MESNKNLDFFHKTSNQYSQLGLGQHISPEKIQEQRDQMRESWEEIMKEKGIMKKII